MIDHKDLIACAKSSKVLTFDIEYKATEFGYHAPGFDIHGCGFATICDGSIISEYYKDRAIIQELIDECFTMDIHCIAHYAQSDIAGLIAAGYRVPDHFLLDDTILILSLLDENRKSYGLKQIARSVYKVDMEDYNEAASDGLDSERFYKYGKLDVQVELKIFCDNYDDLKNSPAYDLYRNHLTPSLRTYADIMLSGMYWDRDYGRDLYLKIVPKIQQLEKRIFASIGKINLGSTTQLANRLFRDLGYSTEGLALTATGKIGLGAKNMKILASKNKVCADIVTWRSLNKLLSTYLLDFMNKMQHTGKVFANFSIHSATGRTRSSDSNLQNVPTKFKNPMLSDLTLRKGFSCPPGKSIIIADFAGLELRVGATVCQEPFFQHAFRKYRCPVCGSEGESRTILHKCPHCGAVENEKAGFWHGADLHAMTRDEIPELNGDRQLAKTINFSILFLASPYRLHKENPQLSVDEWDAIITAYFKRLPGVRRYHRNQEQLYMNGKASIDIFGRRRFLPLPKKRGDLKEYKRAYKHGLNQIVNQPIQGPGATLTQIAQNDLRKLWLGKGWWRTKAVINCSVHDEIVVTCDEVLAEQAKDDLQSCMENCERFLDVPLRADAKICKTWNEK